MRLKLADEVAKISVFHVCCQLFLEKHAPNAILVTPARPLGDALCPAASADSLEAVLDKPCAVGRVTWIIMLRRIKSGRALGSIGVGSIYNAAFGLLPGWRLPMAALEGVAQQPINCDGKCGRCALPAWSSPGGTPEAGPPGKQRGAVTGSA